MTQVIRSPIRTPASSTDNAVVRWDGTIGKLIQNSVVTIGDTGNIVTTGTITVGDPNALAGQLNVKGGASGTDLITLQRTVGVTLTYGWSLGGGGLTFSDRTNNVSVMGLYGDGSRRALNFGIRAQTVSDVLPCDLAATNFSATAGTDVAGVSFNIIGSRGTGAGAVADINFFTATAGVSGTTTQTSTYRATIKGGTGRLGINTTAPGRQVEINEASGNCLRLTYNDTNGSATTYLDALVSSAGAISFTAAGSAPAFIFNSTIRFKNYTVATLPAGVQGDRAYVTDALAPVFLAIVAGGGAVVAPVFYNGTNWVVA